MLDVFKRHKTQVYELLAVIEKEEGGAYYGYCPALKGLCVSGATVEDTLETVKRAAASYFRSLIKHGDPIPVGPFLNAD